MSAMPAVIPCIDLMGGKVVQLVQGQRKALELESPDEAIEMFKDFPLLHIIDLDAALGTGENDELIRYLLTKVRARVGGGVRSVERAKALVGLGAEQVIVGTAAFSESGIRVDYLTNLAREIGIGRLMIAIDVKDGSIAIRGWKDKLAMRPSEAVTQLESYCSGFLCTYVDKEGMMQGTDLPFFLKLRQQTEQTLVAAGGITIMEEIQALLEAEIQVALGMAVYTGKLSLEELAGLQNYGRT